MPDYKKFFEYWHDLYGTGLKIAGWHLNGELEDFDNFFDSAVASMELPSAQHLRSSEAACPREQASVLLLAPLGKRHEFFAFDPHFLFREPNAGPPSVRYLE